MRSKVRGEPLSGFAPPTVWLVTWRRDALSPMGADLADSAD